MRMTLAQINAATAAHQRRYRAQLVDQLVVARGAQATEDGYEQVLGALKDG